jgi:hypothetical protein
MVPDISTERQTSKPGKTARNLLEGKNVVQAAASYRLKSTTLELLRTFLETSICYDVVTTYSKFGVEVLTRGCPACTLRGKEEGGEDFYGCGLSFLVATFNFGGFLDQLIRL